MDEWMKKTAGEHDGLELPAFPLTFNISLNVLDLNTFRRRFLVFNSASFFPRGKHTDVTKLSFSYRGHLAVSGTWSI